MNEDKKKVDITFDDILSADKAPDNSSGAFGVFDVKPSKDPMESAEKFIFSEPGDFTAPLNLVAKDYEDYGVVINPIDRNLDQQRARNQSAIAQFGNSLMQGVVGEIVGGTIEGFGAIGDVITGAAFKDDNDYQNAITQLGSGIREGIQENFPIYQENPEAALDFGDSGYIFSRLPSVLSSISLMIPASASTGILKILGKGAGKIARASKLGKTIEEAAKAGKYGKSMQAAFSPYNMNKIKSYTESAVTAAGMRLGENYQEARQVNEQVKGETITYFNSIPEDEYNKWINDNKDSEIFKGVDLKDKEAAANRIASKAAGRDFVVNLANFAFDFLQLRALSSAWKNMATRPASYEAAQANLAAARSIGQSTTESVAMAQKSASSKVLEAAKRAIIGTKEVTIAEASEGFEEATNYIGTQEGLIYGRQLNGMIAEGDTKAVNEMRDYLRDPMLYDSALWGIIGGVVFHGLGEGFGHLKNKIAKIEDIDNNQRLAEINSRQLKWADAQDKIRKINEGVNPFEINTDNEGNPVIRDGRIEYKPITSDEERNYLRDKVDNDIITNLSLNAIRVGNYGLLKDYLNEPAVRERLVASGFSTEGDYESYSDKINRIADRTFEKYKGYSELLHNADINDIELTMLISNNIYTDNAIEDIQNRMDSLRDKNDNIANNNEVINNLRATEDIDTKFRLGILQKIRQDYLSEKAKYKGTSPRSKAASTELDTYIKAIDDILETDKVNLSPVELFKFELQDKILKGVDNESINKDIEAFKAENPDVNISDLKLSFREINNFSRNINQDYIDNLYDSAVYNIEQQKYKNSKVITQKDAEKKAAENRARMEEMRKRAIDKARTSIMNNLKGDKSDEVYNYLINGERGTLTNDEIKNIDFDKQVLIADEGDKFGESIKTEYEKVKKQRGDITAPVSTPVGDIQQSTPTPISAPVVEPTSTATTEAPAQPKPVQPKPVEKKVSIEQTVDTAAAKQVNDLATKMAETNVPEFTEQELIDNEFKVVKPFTYKGETYHSIEIIPTNYGTTINIADKNGFEENITPKQLQYLVANGFVSSTGVVTQATDEVLESAIDEGNINAVRDRFNAGVGLVEAYLKATGRDSQIDGKTKLSLEDMMRYLTDSVGEVMAKNLFGDVKAIVDYMVNVNQNIILTDNRELLNASNNTFIEKISKPKIEEIVETAKKDNTPAVFQAFVTNKISETEIKTEEDRRKYDALMTIKNGDKLTATVNANGGIDITNNDIIIATLPTINVGETGAYQATNEFWNYNINLTNDGTNRYIDPFIEDIKSVLNNSDNEINYNFLNALENLRVAINIGDDSFTNSALKELLDNKVYEDLINKYGAKTSSTEDTLKQAKHILKLFGYNNNVEITMYAAHPIIAQSLDYWVDKLGSNYSNINNLKNNLGKYNNQVIVSNVTSGRLIKNTDNEGKPKYSPITENITAENSDDFKLYFPTSNGMLLEEGNPNDALSTDSTFRQGEIVLFTKDSNGNKIPIHVFNNTLDGKLYKTTSNVKLISDSIYQTIYNGITQMFEGNVATIEETVQVIRKYVGRGKLLYGIDIVPTANGYAINFSNGLDLFLNYKGDTVSVVPYYNKRRITYKNNEGREFNVGYYAPNAANTRYSTADSIKNIKRLVNSYDNALRNNYMKDAILNNGKAGHDYGLDVISNDKDGNFVITLPNGTTITDGTYKDYLIKNNLIVTDVGAVKDNNGNILGNFIESGEGIGFDKNLYVTLDTNAKEEIKPVETKTEIIDTNEAKTAINEGRTLTEIAHAFGINSYDPVLTLLEDLGINISAKIESNRGYPNRNAIYNIDTHTISVYNKLFKLDPDRAVRVLIHEGLHHYISQLDNYNEISTKFEDVYNKFKEAIDIQTNEDIKSNMTKYLGNKDAKTNLEEFVVESLTNKELMNYLNSIAYDSSKPVSEGNSLFKKLLDVMKELFFNAIGINDKSLLAQVNSIVNEFENNIRQEISNVEQTIETEIDDNITPVEETNIIDIVSDDTSAFDDFISDEFIMESSVDEGNQRAMGSINSLLSRMNDYDKDRFNSLYNDGIPNIVCK